VIDTLRRPMHDVASLPVADDGVLDGEDLPLAVYVLHELHHRGFEGVDDGWEWEPSLLGARRFLERELMGRLVAEVGRPTASDDLAWTLDEVGGSTRSSVLWAWLAERASVPQLCELWAVHAPARRRAGTSMLGHGDTPSSPSDPLGSLDDSCTFDLDRVPGWALTRANVFACLRLQRRWRAALAGWFAAEEQLAAVAAPAAAATLERLGLQPPALDLNGLVARRDAAALARRQPGMAEDVLLGGLAARRMDAVLTRRALLEWQAGRSLLLPDPTLVGVA
jgi:hypothetical protein